MGDQPDEATDVGPDVDDEGVVSGAPGTTSGGPDPDVLGVEDDGDLPSYDDLLDELTEYRDALLRVKAEFDNHRKRVERERVAMAAQASARLAGELLAVLDSCDAAIAQGASDVEPVQRALLDVLVKEGLEVLPTDDVPFDPNLHEAVLHEEGDGGESLVVETLRTGYVWQGTVLRPAMVRVRG